MKAKNLLLVFAATFLFSMLHAKGTNSWMDSAIAEGVHKIQRSEAIRTGSYIPTEWDKLNHLDRMQFVIEIDLAKWTPTLAENQFYYQRTNSPAFNSIGSGSFRIWDSLNAYHLSYENHPDYVPYYNIVLKNFPLELRKDISSVKTSEGQNLYTQLQGLGAIKTEDYQESLDKFRMIIDNICVLVQTNFNTGRMVCFGSANFLGQYGNKPNMRASFGSFYVAQSGFPINYTWLGDLQRIPKYMCPPIQDLEQPTLDEKNFKIALAVKHFIQCNVYNDCSMNSQDFSNQYAAWLYDNLKNAGNISKPLLLNTCIRLNQLSPSMAWSVLTADYENGFASYEHNPLGSLYSFYTNATLNTISLYTKQILRAENQFLTNADINRDSALYYGRFLYRIPAVMTTISTTQRVNLLKKITASSCNDIKEVTEASDYENHCERICKSLYQNLPPGEEKNFLLQLKSTGTIWNLSYRLDNATFGFFGKDNYTDFIFTISSYWKKAFPEKANPSTGANVNFYVYKWESAFFDNNGWIVVNHASNTVFSVTSYRPGFNGAPGSTNHISDIYDPVMIHPKEGSLIPDLPGIKDLVVPALFLDWLSHKKTMNDIGTATQAGIAALGLATGIGEFYMAASITMRVVSAIEIAVAASDLVLLNESVRQTVIAQFPTVEEGTAFLESYQNITMMVNIAASAKGLIGSFESDVARFTAKFDEKEAALRAALGEGSVEYSGMRKLRGELGEVMVASQWLDELEAVLGAGSKWKIQGWIDNGLDAAKLEVAFASTSEKVVLFNNLENAKSIYHQRVYIKDWDNIPGISSTPYINNGLPEQTLNASNFGETNPAYNLPSYRCKTFTGSAELVTLPENTKLYRVTDIGGENGGYWTLTPPNNLNEVIGGTAVMPEWNGFSKVYEYTVPSGGIKVWKGPAAAQPITENLSLSISNKCLAGGDMQVFINDIIRTQAGFNSRISDVTYLYKVW